MPPEQVKAFASTQYFWKRKVVWVIVAAIPALIIVWVVGAQLYLSTDGQSSNNPQLNTPIPGMWYQSNAENVDPRNTEQLPNDAIPSSWYHSNTENIRFRIPEGWVIGSTGNLSLPSGFKEPAIVLWNDMWGPGPDCIIAVAKRDTPFFPELKQISFADRIYSSWTQFVGNWWLASTSDYSTSNHARQSGEFRVSTSVRNNPFILFMNNEIAVPDICNSNLNALLKTVEPYYESMRLTSSSSGMLTTDKVWDDVTSDTANKSYEHFVFTAGGSKERREVMKIPTGTWAGRFSVSGGKLYVPSNSYKVNEVEKRASYDSSLYVLDPFGGQITQVPGTTRADTYISSLFIQNDTAYYLASSSALAWCLDGSRPCAADLYSIPLAGGKATLIGHSSIGGSILGYVESEKAFYILQGWGDAGCSSTRISRIVEGKEESIENFGGCFGESEAENIAYTQMEEKINSITEKVSAFSGVSSRGIRIENGTLQPARGVVSGYAIFYFDTE